MLAMYLGAFGWMDLYGFGRLSLDEHGLNWIYMDLCGFTLIWVGLHEFKWIHMVSSIFIWIAVDSGGFPGRGCLAACPFKLN